VFDKSPPIVLRTSLARVDAATCRPRGVPWLAQIRPGGVVVVVVGEIAVEVVVMLSLPWLLDSFRKRLDAPLATNPVATTMIPTTMMMTTSQTVIVVVEVVVVEVVVVPIVPCH
jgi:hypothetical protein